MIPKFKTYLEESVWGDIRKKSLGVEKRIEEDIDLMGGKEFYNYLKKKYYFPRDYYFKFYDDIGMVDIPLCQQDAQVHFLMYKPTKHQLYVSKSFISYLKLKNIYEQFNNKYRLEEQIAEYNISIFIDPKDGGEVTNSFCAEVLEFIIDLMDGNVRQDMIMVLRKANESVWGDIRKKSLGVETRIEDNVDEMGFDEFYGYVESHYKNKVYKIDQSVVYGGDGYHTCEVYFTENVYLLIYFYEKESREKRITFAWELVGIEQDFIKKLGDNFNIEVSNFGFINIIVDDTYRSNSTYIRLLDFILENQNKMLVESVWADIRKKSLGKEERIEDDINNLDSEGLTDYLKKCYKPLNSFAIITNVGNIISVPIIREHTNRCIMFSHETKSVKMTNDIMDQVQGLLRVMENNFSIETFEGEDGNGEYKVYKILPKDGSEVTNKFFIEVIDFLLYHIPGHLYKKSIMKIDDKS